MKLSMLKAWISRMVRQNGARIAYVDYLQLVNGEIKKGENRTQEVGKVSRELKALAKNLDIPIIALAQLNREIEKRTDQRPKLSDLRDSGEVEQDADLIIFPFRPEMTVAEGGVIEVAGIGNVVGTGYTRTELAKHRNGGVGVAELRFDAERTHFVDWSHDLPDGTQPVKHWQEDEKEPDTPF
jgi:replicative DNA helicase